MGSKVTLSHQAIHASRTVAVTTVGDDGIRGGIQADGTGGVVAALARGLFWSACGSRHAGWLAGPDGGNLVRTPPKDSHPHHGNPHEKERHHARNPVHHVG